MDTIFEKLNKGWNADPNDPQVRIEKVGPDLRVSFDLNAFEFPEFKEGQRGELLFMHCTRHRMGRVNDEGWFRGHCRFSSLAPSWGEFYEVHGDLLLDQIPNDWQSGVETDMETRHFLFYFRDAEFECDATDVTWHIQRTEQDADRKPDHVPS